jgi:hypothetical protein
VEEFSTQRIFLGFYHNSSGKVKNKILSCIFSEKIHFDENRDAAFIDLNSNFVIITIKKSIIFLIIKFILTEFIKPHMLETKKIMKKVLISLAFLFISLSTFAQEESNTYNNPAFLKSVQGTWIHDTPGDWWNKAVIKGDIITLYNAKPSKGRWNDRREGYNENVILKVTSSYKVVKKGRNNYNGKPYTKSYSILETTRIDYGNHKGPFFSMSNGMLEQWGLDSQDNTGANPESPSVIFRKVPSNYNPWQ